MPFLVMRFGFELRCDQFSQLRIIASGAKMFE